MTRSNDPQTSSTPTDGNSIEGVPDDLRPRSPSGPSEPVSSNLATFLERKRGELRSRFRIRELTPEERRQDEDASWAEQDSDVQSHYRGEFVVPYERKIVAHGHDARAVLEEATRVTGRKAQDLPLVGVIDPLADPASE